MNLDKSYNSAVKDKFTIQPGLKVCVQYALLPGGKYKLRYESHGLSTPNFESNEGGNLDMDKLQRRIIKKLKRILIDNHIKQVELAYSVELSKGTLSAILKGKRRVGLEVLLRISNHLNIPLWSFLIE